MMSIDELKKEIRFVIKMLNASDLPTEQTRRVVQAYDDIASSIATNIESIRTTHDTLRFSETIDHIKELLDIVPTNKSTK